MAEEAMALVDAAGTEYPLDGITQPQLLWGHRGRFMPPYRIKEEIVPGQPGARVRDVRPDVRELALSWVAEGATNIALRTLLRAWASRLDPERGDARIRATAPDGSRRELYCRYQGGFEGEEADGAAGRDWLKSILIFRAHDPLWYDLATNTDTYTAGGVVANFFPIFPLRLANSEVFSEPTVDNDGDYLTWPLWVITGPGSSPILRNLTTDKAIDLSGAVLTAGESITIDTAPGRKTVQKQDGTNLFGSMTDESSLWPLERGPNSIRIEMTGAGGGSQVQLSWRRRFLVP